MTPERLSSRDPRLGRTLKLMQHVFSEQNGRIDPPSSINHLSLKDLQDRADDGGLWVIGDPPVATMMTRKKANALYISKLAAAPEMRGQGLARSLVTCAEQVARKEGLSVLELQSRVELTETHAAFLALGFVKAGETAHPGYLRPTSITMRKDLRPIRSRDARG